MKAKVSHLVRSPFSLFLQNSDTLYVLFAMQFGFIKKLLRILSHGLIATFLLVCSLGVLLPFCQFITSPDSFTFKFLTNSVDTANIFLTPIKLKPVFKMYSNPQKLDNSWFDFNFRFTDQSNATISTEDSARWGFGGILDRARFYRYTQQLQGADPTLKPLLLKDLSRFAVQRGNLENKAIAKVTVFLRVLPVRTFFNLNEKIIPNGTKVAEFDSKDLGELK